MESIGPSSHLQSFSRSPGLLDRKSLGVGSKAAGLPETRGQLSTLQGPRAAQLPGSGWIHGQRSRSLRCLATARAPSSGWTRHQRWDFPDLGVAGRQQKIVPTGFNGQIDIPANPRDHLASEVSPKAGWSNSQKSSSSRILARTRASAPIWNCCSRNSGALGQHKNHSDSRWSFHGCKIVKPSHFGAWKDLSHHQVAPSSGWSHLQTSGSSAHVGTEPDPVYRWSHHQSSKIQGHLAAPHPPKSHWLGFEGWASGCLMESSDLASFAENPSPSWGSDWTSAQRSGVRDSGGPARKFQLGFRNKVQNIWPWTV